MSNPQLKDMLAHSGIRMASDLRAQLVPHRGEQGAAREEIIRQFLRAHLPKRFEVSSGFVFDAQGDVSQQVDIIIADSLVCPRFEAAGGVRFYPCEAVVAVGQIKTKISSRKELWEALCNLRSVTLLDRTADGKAFCDTTGEPIDHRKNHIHRIFTFLFITDRAPVAELARDVLMEYVQRSDPHLWPNIILALDKYMITYCCDAGICPNPMDARGIASVLAEDSADSLLRFYILLSQAISVTSVARMSSWAYLGELVTFKGDVIYSCANLADEPPPYLSALQTKPWGSPFDDKADKKDSDGSAAEP